MLEDEGWALKEAIARWERVREHAGNKGNEGGLGLVAALEVGNRSWDSHLLENDLRPSKTTTSTKVMSAELSSSRIISISCIVSKQSSPPCNSPSTGIQAQQSHPSSNLIFERLLAPRSILLRFVGRVILHVIVSGQVDSLDWSVRVPDTMIGGLRRFPRSRRFTPSSLGRPCFTRRIVFRSIRKMRSPALGVRGGHCCRSLFMKVIGDERIFWIPCG